MGLILTPENWKQHRESEANRLFSVDMDVQYSHGYVTFTHDNFGRVTRITKAGCIYVAKIDLKEVDRDCDQGGGWIRYDPKQVEISDYVMRFLPKLGCKGYGSTLEHFIGWEGPQRSGDYRLRNLDIGKDGLVKANRDGCL